MPKHILLNAERGTDVGEWRLADEHAAWSVEQKVLHGGKQEGSKLLIITTDALTLTLIPTRGMGILSAISGDVRLGWDSPIRDVVHPGFMNLESRNGLGWLEGFNEWMCRCGLEFSGHPGTDEFINNTGAKDTMNLSLHGKIANIPCSYVEIEIEESDTTRIIVRSKVEERVFHGPKLELWSEVSFVVGSSQFHIHDTVTNKSSGPQEFQMLYHCNFGSPLLTSNARLIASVKSNEPFNDRAAEGLNTFDTFEAPTPNFIEQVYKMTLNADDNGFSTVMLHNSDGTRAASMRFSVRELPCFTLWKNTDAVNDGYVAGLEPGTSFPHNRRLERLAGRVPVLEPGASRTFKLDILLHLDRDSVAAQKQSIEKIA